MGGPWHPAKLALITLEECVLDLMPPPACSKRNDDIIHLQKSCYEDDVINTLV